nr:ribonuclease H-like domain-containing protein [Tanacetum cinerariifolium]
MDLMIPLGQTNTLVEYMILSGADNHPPMLDKDLYDSWKSRIELYMQNRENGRMILETVKNGPLIWPTIKENRETNIILQGLPADIYSLVNHHRVAKDLWERVQLLMQGTRANTSGTRGIYLGQQRVVKCFNCQGIAQEKGKVLNEEELEFLVDPGVAECPITQSVITHNVAYQANDLDAYDSDCNKISTAKSALMANLLSYDSDVLSEIRPMLYDGSVIAKETNVISIVDSKETLMLKEERMYKFDPVTLALRDKNNRKTHIYYLKHTMEQAVILREIVEQARSLNPLDSASYSACNVKNDLRKLKGKEIVDNVTQVPNATTIAPGMYKFDPVTLALRDKNNKGTHIYYLKHTMEQAVILREIVEQARSLNPLDSASYSACKSKPSGNIKNDRIPLTPSSNEKNKVEVQSKKVKSSLNKQNSDSKNVYNEHVKHPVKGVKALCFVCNECLFDANHAMCLIDHVNSMNDLCGPMRVASVNGKKYILVIVDDYSRFTWVKFLASKDEAFDFIIKFLKMIQVRLNAAVRNIRIDNGTKMEAHCIALELKSQNKALKSGQHGHDLNDATLANFRKENETLKKHYKDLYDSIKITRSKTIEQTTSLLANNADLKAQIQEKVFAIAALKNDLRNSNDMVHNHYLGEAKKKTRERDRNSKPSVMTSARFQSTTTDSKPKPRSPNHSSRSFPMSKSSCVMITAMPKVAHSKSPSSFFDPTRFFCSTCHKWLPTGKLFDSCTSKAEREPTHGFNADVSNIHECKQILDLSAGTSINVTQEQSLAISAAHNSSDPAPTCQKMASVQISYDPAPEYTTSIELDLLFSTMFDEVLNGSSKVVSKSSAVSADDAPNKRQQPTTPLNNHTTPAPTCQNPSIASSVTSNENINQAEPHAENDEVADDEFINIFSTPVQDQGETSSRHVDSSNMHTFYQRYPSEQCWTKDHPLE